MGELKNKAINNTSNEDVQEFNLEDSEANLLRLMNLSLQYHTFAQKLMSGFLYYVATHRLGYKEGVNLQFHFDFDKPENILTITLLPADFSHQTQPQQPPATD